MHARASTPVRLAFAASFVLGGVLGAGACNEKKATETPADARASAEAGMTSEADAGAGEAGTGADGGSSTETTSDAAATAATAVAAGASDGGLKRATDSGSGSIETAAHGGVDGGAKASAVAIDESAAGKTIDLVAGQSLTLSLGANATTGFDWSVTKAPAALGAPELTYVQGGAQPGAPGTRKITWTLKSALPAGEHAVELAYARSFEKGVAPFKTFKLKVRSPR